MYVCKLIYRQKNMEYLYSETNCLFFVGFGKELRVLELIVGGELYCAYFNQHTNVKGGSGRITHRKILKIKMHCGDNLNGNLQK